MLSLAFTWTLCTYSYAYVHIHSCIQMCMYSGIHVQMFMSLLYLVADYSRMALQTTVKVWPDKTTLLWGTTHSGCTGFGRHCFSQDTNSKISESCLFYFITIHFFQYFLAKQIELYKHHITSTHVGLWSQGKTKASKNITKTWTHIHKYSFIIFVILSYITCRRARGESYSRGCFCKFLFFFFS